MGPKRHPSALGQRGRDCWQKYRDIIGPQIELVMAGKGSTWHVDQLVPVTRHGRRENVWWTYGYSPTDHAGKVGRKCILHAMLQLANEKPLLSACTGRSRGAHPSGTPALRMPS